VKLGRITILLRVVAATALLVGATACGANEKSDEQSEPVPVERVKVIGEMPHDPTAFTQGLQFDGANLYESTGMVGKSELRQIDPANGAVIRSAPLPPDFFGEGLAIVGDKIWQLTWRNGVAIEWDKATFKPIRQVPMSGEGWGLCYDGSRLIRSDGTNTLHFHDPATFAETGSVAVTNEGAPFSKLNELECVDGQVWANQFMTERIARIDPGTGKVTEIVDASGLLDPQRRAQADVLNGIAYTGTDEEFLVTGKYWPAMFRVQFGSQ